MLSTLLISDIHFRREKRLGGADRDIDLRNGLLDFLPELQERVPTPKLVLVCGDVAFQGVEHEYGLAREFLREVQAELRGARILVIPGNHDIDRQIATRPEQRTWRSTPRHATLTDDQRDDELMKLLNHAEAGPGLFAPLAAYNEFAALYQCDVSVADPNAYWETTVEINDRYRAQIRGMTSVLISDSNDNDNSERLLAGEFQANGLRRRVPGVVNVTMCHHPYTWLFDGERQQHKLDGRSVLHITGHDHNHEIVRSGGSTGVQLRAGALQPTRNPDWMPRVYGLVIDVDESTDTCLAKIQIVSAAWSREDDQFVIDVDVVEEVPITRAEDGAGAAPDPRILQLTERLGGLQTADIWDIAADIGANLGQLARGPLYEIPQRLVELAQADGKLSELWESAELRHGRQMSENPFR